ncbi:TPA: DUF2482 family protein [Staphylococcus aureus]|nr:DUF2482 family protein [Staphylococcus aureus]HDJ1605144.1 DUF2482 family protein [Staphylococcus aureus]
MKKQLTNKVYQFWGKTTMKNEFDALLFSTVGVSNGHTTSSSHCALGDIAGLANLLNNENDYHDIANVIEMYKLKKFLGIDDDKDDDNNEE